MERREKIRYDVQQAVQYVLEPRGSDSEMSELDDEENDLEDESLELQLNEQGLEFNSMFTLGPL